MPERAACDQSAATAAIVGNCGGGGFCARRPPNADPQDYEVRVEVDFENRLLRPLSVAGVNEDAKSEVLLFARDRCQPDCATEGCLKCRPRKLYHGPASNPKGAVAFRPHSEYLYCLRFDRQPVTALLSLTPREHNIEVKELGLLAYWFATWFQRAKASNRPGSDSDDDAKVSKTPSAQVAEAAVDAAAVEGSIGYAGGAAASRGPAAAASLRNLNATSKYLPNLRVIYEVKKELMTVTMPEPYQLTREIDVLLVNRQDSGEEPQAVTLFPGKPQASCQLATARDTPYTLMVRLKDQGSPLKLLDLVTERKVLRVQESIQAPKHMNFLMERRVDQRATFVLHITFDETAIAVDNKWLGEFYLDVDVDNQTLNIGTVPGHERKMYRVEKLCGPDAEDLTKARRLRVFEGGVDGASLFIESPIQIAKMSDYLITVLDTDAGKELQTSVLSFKKSSLFVKEVKGSDVKLHVTVQREFDSAAVTNENNFPDTEESGQSQMVATETFLPIVRRCQPDGVFHCPIRDGCTKYRILHNSGAGGDRRGRAGSRLSAASSAATSAAAAAATEAAVAAADASCYSSGGFGCDDSGLGRNYSSLSEDSVATSCQERLRRLQQRHQQDYNVNLDVDLPKLQARLLPGVGSGAENVARHDGSSGCYLIVEVSLTDGRSRSIPCQLGQAFGVRHWCCYTVKAIGDSRVSPLFTFRLTDAEVTDIRPCNPTVRLTKNVSKNR